MRLWNSLNPKIKVVAIGAALVAIASILNAITSVYPNTWYDPIIASVLLLIAGYRKAA